MRYSLILILVSLLSGCHDSNDQPNEPKLTAEQKKELQKFLDITKSEMVFIKGGKFWMGDFCSKMRKGGAYCTGDKDNKPLHEVELSSLSMSKYKITHERYDFYLNITKGKIDRYGKGTVAEKMLSRFTFLKNSPAIVSWTEARNYCKWLNKETGLPFALSTEAQWEYAARNRGKYDMVSTDDGTYRVNKKTQKGENFATDRDRDEIGEPYGILSPLIRFAVDKYPPSPLGLYSMADNGREWVSDWYDPNYYKVSPSNDPQGPANPVIKDKSEEQYWKVLRGASNPLPGFPSGLSFSRSYEVKDPDVPIGTTARCVVNFPQSIN